MVEEVSTPPIRTLADVMALVDVTPSQGVHFLNTLAEANADKDPTLLAALYDAIQQLQAI